jgi:predicted nuclease of restriction endonuclease-like (RecB) superfamily
MIELSQKIISLIESSRFLVTRVTNSTMVFTYFVVGKMIVEELQEGENRAEYGAKLLKKVSEDLNLRLGRGYSVDNLENMRKFYVAYSQQFTISESNSRILYNESNSETISRKYEQQYLSWSHYLVLTKIDNKAERYFYEIESLKNNWNLSELKRQYNSSLYERLALSTNKEKVKELSLKGQVIERPQDIFKEPLVLEFLGLPEKSEYSETDLEKAIINEIEKFMLEMGKGFFFGGRQVRFTYDEEHYIVDLVFYNRLLQCFVLIDLKIGKLTHQDLGQMQMYVNYYDRYVKAEQENKTIGIILCKNKNQSLVEITLPIENEQIFASKYQTILPSKNELQKLLDGYY